MNGSIFEGYAAVIKSPSNNFWYKTILGFAFDRKQSIPFGEVRMFVSYLSFCRLQPIYMTNDFC